MESPQGSMRGSLSHGRKTQKVTFKNPLNKSPKETPPSILLPALRSKTQKIMAAIANGQKLTENFVTQSASEHSQSPDCSRTDCKYNKYSISSVIIIVLYPNIH